jgi:hypothetical protein
VVLVDYISKTKKVLYKKKPPIHITGGFFAACVEWGESIHNSIIDQDVAIIEGYRYVPCLMKKRRILIGELMRKIRAIILRKEITHADNSGKRV